MLLAAMAQAQYYNYYPNVAAYSGYPYAYSGYPQAYSGYPQAYSGYTPYAYAPAVTANQYHSQDELGQASFGYSHPGQAAVNYRDAFGNQVGSYAYINPDGKEIRVSYVADSNGFRVLSNALPEGPVVPEAAALAMPEPVQDTPEVVEARKAHMIAFESAKNGVIMSPILSADDLPKPVEDTPEVAAAKADHAKAWEAALAAAEAAGDDSGAESSRKKRQLLYYPSVFRTAVVAPVAPAVPATPVREATLSKTVHNPGHAVSYRVD